MNPVNNAALIRRELMVRLCRIIFEEELYSQIDRIPLEMIPRERDSFRCCVYKDRAVLRYRLMALLGFSIEEEQDELLPLADYARAANERVSPEKKILTVLDEACRSCLQTSYHITDVCQGCLARPCLLNCPKDAITMHNGKALIDPEKCVNCGICMRACPYHAIIRMPIPCEEACPVDAISRNEHNKQTIDQEKCILCGKCMQECPFGAIMEKSQLLEVSMLLKRKQKVVAMIAPAIAGQYSSDFAQIIQALKQVGFLETIEVSAGADITTEKEAEEFKERMQEEKSFMTTSCCPSFVKAAHAHIPNLVAHISTTQSPMHFTAQLAKERFPEAVRIFIGPCTAKKEEAMRNNLVDYVLTFEELGAIFVANNIDVSQLPKTEAMLAGTALGRGFPVSGGVTASIQKAMDPDLEIKPYLIDGLSKKNMALLKSFANNKCPANFIEVMGCEGGCVNGPAVISNPKIAAREVKKLQSED